MASLIIQQVMNTLYGYTIRVNDAATASLRAISAQLTKNETGFRSVLKASTDFSSLALNAQRVVSTLGGLTAPAIAFERSMSEVKAITNATTAQMDIMRQASLRLSPQFGIKAVDSMNAFKLGISELGPELAKNGTALELYGRNVAVLSKQMGGDQVAASQVLNAAMLQYGSGLKDPMKATQEMTRMMNIMSASAAEGSAELPQLKDTFIKAAPAAKAAGIGFADLVAATQAVAKGGLKGAESGVAMNAVFMRLSTAQGLPAKVIASMQKAGVNMQLLTDKTAPLATRLQEVMKIRNNNVLMQDVFGSDAGNTAAREALLNNMMMIQQGAGGLRDKIVSAANSTDAFRQANIIMGDTQGRLDRQAAIWDVLKIRAGSALTTYAPMLNAMGSMTMIGANLAPVISWMGKASMTSARWMWGLAGSLWGSVTAAWANRTALLFNVGVMASMARTRIIAMLASLAGTLRMATVAQWLLNTAMLMNPIGIVIAALAALGTGVYLVIKNWDVLKQYIVGFGLFMWKAFLYSNPIGWMILGVQKLMTMFPALGKLAGDTWQWILGAFMKVWEGIKGAFAWIRDALGMGDMPTIKAEVGSAAGAGFNAAAADGTAAPAAQNGMTAASDMANSIAGGGSKPTSITINIKALNEKIEVQAATLREGAAEIEAVFNELFLRVVNSAAQVQA